MTTASTNYSDNPTPAYCTSYKNSVLDYLDALEGVRTCVAGASQVQFNKAFDDEK